MAKKKKSQSSVFKCLTLKNVFFCLLAFSNLLTSAYLIFTKRRVNQITYSPRLVSVGSVTNSFPSSLSLSSVSNLVRSSRTLQSSSTVDTVSSSSSVSSFDLSYEVCFVDGFYMARLFGFWYGPGDSLSYGVIDSVYPDRIFVNAGSVVLRNTNLNPRYTTFLPQPYEVQNEHARTSSNGDRLTP